MNHQQWWKYHFDAVFSAIPSILPQVTEWTTLSFGGSKFVYKGKIKGKWEAIKVCPLDLTSGGTLASRAKLEIEALERCKSPYIVKLGQIEPHVTNIQGLDVLVYSEQYLEGESLHNLMENGYQPPEDELKLLFRCLLAALKETASLGLVHRDIKPGNIIKSSSLPAFILIDFSIALLIETETSYLTSTGIGSPRTNMYAAPELFDNEYHKIVSYRTDLYCLAYTIFSYAIGEPYFQTIQEIIGDKSCPLLSDIRRDISFPFAQMLAKLLKKDPNLRSSNIDKLQGELETL